MTGKILITGASSGIGKEYANFFAQEKKDLIIIARNKKRLDDFKKELITNHKINCESIVCDLSKIEDVKKLITSLEKENIEVLINNAGFGIDTNFSKANAKDIEDMVNTHVLSTTLLTKNLLEKMLIKNKGTIINVASIAGYLYNSKSNIIYNSTKRYLISFSVGLQDEIKRHGKNIKVQVLCPGYTKTNFFKNYDLKRNKLFRPEFLYMTAEDVVKYSIKKLKSKKVICIPGFKNRLIVFLLKLGIYN